MVGELVHFKMPPACFAASVVSAVMSNIGAKLWAGVIRGTDGVVLSATGASVATFVPFSVAGIAAAAKSYAVLTAFGVAAMLSSVELVELESRVRPK